jgi:filamin
MSESWGNQVEPKWVEIQKKTFTRWANTFLKERLLKVDDLGKDLADGVLLINLLEIISGKTLGKYNKQPKIRTHQLENNMFALDFLKKEGIKLVNIANEDIVDCKLKLILGLIWTIILRYQINIAEGKSARSELLEWVRSKIPEYNINNFATDWNDGKAICALGDALVPGLCPNHRELDRNQALRNATLGIDNAEREMQIPKVLDPQDMINPEVDELSVMTYISYFRDWELHRANRMKQEELERTPVAGKCRAYGPGLERAETGIPTGFTIESINQFGRRVPKGGDPFEVSIQGPNGPVEPNMVDNQNGLYDVTYTAREVGPHTISVTLKGQPIQGSPWKVPVTRSPADASKCRAYGPGVEGGVQQGQAAPFTIEAFDRLGNPLKDGGDNFKVKVTGPYNTDLPANLRDNKNGKYDGEYTPQDYGPHVVDITLNGKPIPNSPFTVNIGKNPEYADFTQCRAYGPGLEPGNSTSEPAKFTVEVRNGKGDLVKKAGSPISVDVTDAEGSEVPVKVRDNEDGTFSVEYQAKDPGVHTVDVMLGHPITPLYYDHIKGSPFKVPIEAGTDASKSRAYGPGLEDGVQDTLPTHFTIEARDRNGNPIKKGGDPFEVKIQGPNGPVDAKIKDNNDGTYLVEYAPSDSGRHKIDVKLKGKDIQDAPFYVNVKEGADHDNSGVESYTFTIRARTKKGSEKKTGGDKFAVKILNSKTNANVEGVKLKDQGDGSYFCSYKLPDSGEYKIHILLNDRDIKGSPFNQTC